MSQIATETSNDRKNHKRIVFNVVLILGFLFVFSYNFLFAPIENKDVIIHVATGESVAQVSQKLKSERSIRNELIFKVCLKVLKSGKGVISGDYLIKKNSPVWVVAWQLGRGHHNIEPIRIVLQEGITNKEIADILADKLAGFRKDLFNELTYDMEGYLFPDTYFFFPQDTASEIVDKIHRNFEDRIKNLMPKINKSDKSLDDIIIMASILEGEARGNEDIGIISGILWKRIAKDMPLQVDVDKKTYDLKGLPKKPLNNPGLRSIDASINPIQTEYYYYLHDENGDVHYAVTYEEHKNNIKKYLK